MSSLTEIGDELYALPPSEFTAARDDQAARARAQGRPADATQVAALRRPTIAAWLVNLVALRRPELVIGLLDLGAQIAAAQGNVDASGVRDLSARRRRAIDDAVRAAVTLAAGTGASAPTPAQLSEVEGTLAAAMADETTGRLVRTARVTRAIVYSGFGDATLAEPAARPPTSPARPTPAGRTPTEQPDPGSAHAAAQHDAAMARLAEATEKLGAATEVERAATSHIDEVLRLIEELNRRLEVAQREARAARAARREAERLLAAAKRNLAGNPPPS